MESLFSPAQRSASPTDAPITDYALIESQKENIRPLATGRSVATLSTVLKEPSAAEKLIQEGHEKHQSAIAEADRRENAGEDMVEGSQDVLEVYYRYVLFTMQHHPSSDAHLLPLLETSTRRFVNDGRYAQDARYLKLWQMYARQIERREEIWAFLESRDIGTKLSSFYEQWAEALERIGRRKKGDEIYRLGIARKALPIERLKTRHREFLQRIQASSSATIPDDDPSTQPARTPSRAVLGQVRAASASGLAGATQMAPSMRSASGAQNGRKMEIFSDDQGKSEDAAPGEWADFGTRDERKKENTVEAGPWKGETLPQSAARGKAPRTPKVEVFQDGDEASKGIQADFEVFSRHRLPPTEAELLKNDPLRHYDTSNLSTDIPSLPAPPSARKPPRPAKASSSQPKQPANSEQFVVMQPWACPTDGPLVTLPNGKKERRMFNWDSVYKDGEEWSFEQIRAKERGLYGKEWRGEVQAWERAWHKPGSTTPVKPKLKEERPKPPSPTVNTKLAEAEVMRMFDQTIHGGKIHDSDDDSDSESEDEDAEEVMQAAPTPLPNRLATVQMLAPTPGGYVPPTPTPSAASRLFGEASTSSKPAVFSDENNVTKPAVFSDENAVPPSASKKFNIFSDNSAVAKTPLGPSSSTKQRLSDILSDENAAPTEPIAETPSQKQPSGSNNIFATPAVSRPVFASRRAEAINEVTEEDEAEQEQAAPSETVGEVADAVAQVCLDEDEYDYCDEDDHPRAMRRFVVNTMTPITERTCEYTQTTGRGSMAPQILEEDEEDEDEDDEDKPRPSAPISMEPYGDSEDGLVSGDVGSGFQLPDGFTIHSAIDSGLHTMVLVDRNEDHTATTAQDRSVYLTATDGQLSLGELPNPCDPTSEQTIAALLGAIDPPLARLPGFVDLRNTSSGKLDTLQKHAKSKMRRASTSSRASTSGDDICPLSLSGKSFEVSEMLGEGGFGVVFLGVDIAAREQQLDEESDDEDDEEREDKSLVAIKVEKPGAVWEAVVLDRIHRRIDESLRASIIYARNLYLFADESYLILDYCPQGTLLDVVNKSASIYGATTPGVDELLAMFFIIELLKLVEGLHEINVIHGDLKIDNCLVRITDLPASQWSATYSPSGTNGWSAQGMRLIDFGRALDLSLFPRGPEQTFKVSHEVDERDCTEMRMGKSWSWETDYFGVAGVAYCLLFGKHIKTEVDNGRVKIDQPLKRYWQAPLWASLFETLLNPGSHLPITSRLKEVRAEFEGWLEENCQKGGKSLKSLLKKIELAATTGKKR